MKQKAFAKALAIVGAASLLFGCATATPMAKQYKMTTAIAPGVMVPDKVETSIGTLNLNYGYPDDATTQKVYDNLDASRALQAYLLAIPIVNQVGMRDSRSESSDRHNQTNVIWEDLVDSKTVELTANDNTIYSFIWLDTKKGPLVVEVPPMVLGLIDDFWYHWVADIGITGADHGKGGKYLILPPGYTGKVPEGYFVVRPSTYGNWMPFRSFLVDGSTKPGVEAVRKYLKIYQLSDAANPPAIKLVNASGIPSNFVPPGDYAFWSLLNEAIQEEPSAGKRSHHAGSVCLHRYRKRQALQSRCANEKDSDGRCEYRRCDRAGDRLQNSRQGRLLLSGQPMASALLRWIQIRGVTRRGQSGRSCLLLLFRHRRHTGHGGENGRQRFAISLVCTGCGRQPVRGRKKLQAAPATEYSGERLLVCHRL